MKKLFLGVAALGLAASISAFTSENDITKSFAGITYYNLGSGVYSQLDPAPTGSCATSDPNACSLIFPNSSDIPAEDLPEEFTYPSYPSNIGSPTAVGPGTRK